MRVYRKDVLVKTTSGATLLSPKGNDRDRSFPAQFNAGVKPAPCRLEWAAKS